MFRTLWLPLVLPLLAVPISAQVQAKAPPSPLDQFQQHIGEYLKLRKSVADDLPKLKPTPSAEELAERKKLLTANLAKARVGAQPGLVFSPDVAAAFRRLGKEAMDGKDGHRVKKSLKNAAPVEGPVHVNEVYPPGVPLQSMPPTLLKVLPKLPKELEYRLVSRTLVLRDAEAGLIIDLLPEAIP